MKQRVTVKDMQNYRVFAIETGLSVRAAWKFFEDDMLLDRDCSKTWLGREGKRGAIYAISHNGKELDSRPCQECDFHRSNRDETPNLAQRRVMWRREERKG